MAHRRPPVDEAHDVEGSAQHRRVLAHRDGRGVGDVGAVEGLDDPPLADDPVVSRRRSLGRRDADGAVEVAPADLVDLVLGAAADEPDLQRLALPGQALLVEPGLELLLVDHWLPTSCSMNSAYLARAASRSLGMWRVGQRSSLAS